MFPWENIRVIGELIIEEVTQLISVHDTKVLLVQWAEYNNWHRIVLLPYIFKEDYYV